ncbi:hypothetical protein NLX65_00480 [Candidatus Cardinium sp. TP]|nr:hypothetical protein [Candidatus Cardinium sp. TP]
MAKLVGYVRGSTQDERIRLQVDALAKEGCATNMIFIDCVIRIGCYSKAVRLTNDL